MHININTFRKHHGLLGMESIVNTLDQCTPGGQTRSSVAQAGRLDMERGQKWGGGEGGGTWPAAEWQ